MRLAGRRITVMVQGELAQSPRMLNHVRALLDAGAAVDLVGYQALALPDDLTARPGLARHPLGGWGTRRWGRLPRPLFIAFAALRAAGLSLRLAWCLVMIRRIDAVLVQNPPALPSLMVVWLVARLRGARWLIDWHNLSSAMLALRLGEDHALVHWLARLEGWMGRRADGHLCVSGALAGRLAARWGLAEIGVLRDCPIAVAAPIARAHRRDVLRRIAAELGTDCGTEDAVLPAILVSPTSWSLDEDMDMLLAALRRYGASAPSPPPVILFATGIGPGRAAFEACAAGLGGTVRIVTGWLPDALYRALLGCADLGISMHRSASGVDLPMKLVDLAAAGVPALAFDYGPCLGELATPVGLFTTADMLAAAIAQRLAEFPDLPIIPAGDRGPSWEAAWRRVALLRLAEAARAIQPATP